MARKRFPNGFASWQETHFNVVSIIAVNLSKVFVPASLSNRYLAQGIGGMYELAEELTDKFEKLNKGREWDGEFAEEIDEFVKKELEL
jgi:hypothetical protein